VAKCLASKYEALSSNPSTAKDKNEFNMLITVLAFHYYAPNPRQWTYKDKGSVVAHSLGGSRL
jgi:hypothetical protein